MLLATTSDVLAATETSAIHNEDRSQLAIHRFNKTKTFTRYIYWLLCVCFTWAYNILYCLNFRLGLFAAKPVEELDNIWLRQVKN